MNHTRAHIHVVTQADILHLINLLYTSEDVFTVEDFTGTRRVNARSLLGVLYIVSECGDKLYLVNDTNDGVFPTALDEMRVLA